MGVPTSLERADIEMEMEEGARPSALAAESLSDDVDLEVDCLRLLLDADLIVLRFLAVFFVLQDSMFKAGLDVVEMGDDGE